jgi:hypothetical protein
MTFNKVNNIAGWIIGLIATTVYVMTMEPTGSLWDCGEFISTAYKLQIPHPPGAPLFVLLGRFFIILFGDNPQNAALAVNFMSALSSGLTIMFLFWTITHFARKLILQINPNQSEINSNQVLAAIAAGTVGALAYTFSDSFWYSAVEGEVYALSSLFTAIVFWAILKWEHEVDAENKEDGHKFSRADRWLVFIFFMMGLSIGVHLLNLLTIPAIVMVYYFKRYKPSRWGTFWAFVIGCIITGVAQVVIIQWSVKGAGAFDIFFVNELGLPFFSGFIFYFVLLFALLLSGLRFNQESVRKFSGFATWLSLIILLFCFPFIKSFKSFLFLAAGIAGLLLVIRSYGKRVASFLKIGIWSAFFMVLGYCTYFTTIIRSNADPAIDMFNVDNPVSLVGYLGREQYGDWPILIGPYFTEDITQEDYKPTGTQYVRGEDSYVAVGEMRNIDYAGMETAHLFPRMYDNRNDRNQHMVYREFGGLDENETPTIANEIKYFFNYQFGWMYWRYLMWNFAGKQNDLQGFGNRRDGNWASGIGFIDKLFIDTADIQPSTASTDNKAYNRLFFLPLILGILGIIYQFKRDRKDFLVTFLLFFFTGFAIVIYLNQAGFQPRERDYAYVGSFYAFSIWIGLGVLWLREMMMKKLSPSVATGLAGVICLLAVPVWMAIQEWDDHDRSQKYLARDLGANYLESTAPNSILFTFGDNDTYPLWYAQEVEGVREDVRAVNYSLLGTDWYINQLRYAINESAPVDVIFSKEHIQGSKRDVIAVYPLPGYDQNRYYNLYDILKDVVASDDPAKTVGMGTERANVLPVRKLSIPVDVEWVKANIPLNPGDSVLSSVEFEIPRNYLQKNDLAVLAVLATTAFKRPVYFTSISELRNLGLDKYMRLEGMVYRFVPILNPAPSLDLSYQNALNFKFGGANTPGTYFDEENRRHINSMRLIHSTIAKALAESGRMDSARQVLNHYDQNVLEENIPYGMTSNRGNFHNSITLDFLEAAYMSGDLALAEKISTSLKKDLNEQLDYYQKLDASGRSREEIAMNAANLLNNRAGVLSGKQMPFIYDIITSYQMLMQIEQWENRFAPQQPVTESAADTLSNQ